jgi:class 3 adenylate cyclase/tetratricopeptide (TPR) repeat protein
VTQIELVVIMVTDLVGSTELASGLGSAEFDALRVEHDSILRDAAEDVGGRTVKNTGDGFLIAFASAAAALDGAVHMQQRLERRNRTAAVALRVRIGIGVGDASVTAEGDYVGSPVAEATRLCDAAAGGEILVAEALRALQRESHRLTATGALAAAAGDEAVAALRVGWTRLPEHAGPPLPPRLASVADTPYVGRVAELGLMREVWERAVAGERQVVIVAGEAGIGKTRLVAQTAKTALPDDAIVLYGRCDEDQAIAYLPWREVLRDYVAIAPRRLLRPHAGELARLVPGLSEKLGALPAPRSADPDTERYLLHEAIHSLLAAAAELPPLLVILDDLQLADRSTLLLLKHLVTAPSAGRLMLLGTYRDAGGAGGDQLTSLLADLYREPAVTRLALGGLAEREIIGLMEELGDDAAAPVDRGLAQELHRETAGNPFFVAELWRHLTETGAFVAAAGEPRRSVGSPLVGHGLPQSVREVIDRRLGRLGEEARLVLSAGAVIGREFDLALVARAVAMSAPRVLDLLDEAMAAALLARTAISRGSLVWPELTEMYAFSHGLVQAALYDALPAGRRAALHRAVGEAIEAGSGGAPDERVGELAHHFLAAVAAGERQRPVEYARRAAELAIGELAYDEAVALLERALAVPDDDGPQRLELLQLLGDARMRAGDVAGARAALVEAAALARRHDRPRELALATRTCAIWGLSLGVDDELVGLAEEAIARLEGAGEPRLLAECKGLLAVALYYAPVAQADRRRQLAAEALAEARAEHERSGDRGSTETLAFVLGRYLLARTGPDSVTEDLPLADEWLELGRELDDVEVALRAHHWRTSMLLELGDLDGLLRELELVERMATELRQPRALAFLPLHRGMLAVMAGRFAEVERLNAEAAAIAARLAGSVSLLAAQSQMLLMRMQQGRMPELEPHLRALVGAFPSLQVLRAGLIVLLLQAGQDAQARAEFELALSAGLAALARDNTYILTLALLGDAAADLGDVERAKELYEQLEPFAGRWIVATSNTALWPVTRSLGRLAGVVGELDLALSQIAAGRRQAEPAQAEPSVALLALDEARVLALRRAPGDVDIARRRADEALVLAQRLGMLRVSAAAARIAADLVGDPVGGA